MKKLIFSLIAVAVGTLGSFAQTDLVATLTHGSELKTFSGENALEEAHEAAVDGDIITLSPGPFKAANISKLITIRGAGYKPMASNGYVLTQIVGNMGISSPSEATTAITVEGILLAGNLSIYGENQAPIILCKSRFNGSVSGWGVSMKATSCIFSGGLSSNHMDSGRYQNTTFTCNNCVIMGPHTNGLYNNSTYNIYALARIIASNCVIRLDYSDLPYCVLSNSVIGSAGSSLILAESCVANNCVGINSCCCPNVFQNILIPTNFMVEGSRSEAYATVFKTWRNNAISTHETFELTDEAAAKYLGEDGTQVGIYGSPYPFDPEPTNPKVKKFTLNSNASNGKLNVKINVE